MFKCICLILRSRLTVTISSGDSISLHDICIVLWPNDAPISPHLMFCLMSAPSCCVWAGLHCSNSVCSVSPSHVSTFYICITISSHNHTATAAGHGKHSYLCQDTWDVIHRTGSQKALLHRICTPSEIHGQVILFTFCYDHFTELLRGQWCAADLVLSVQQVHLVVTRPSPLTITQSTCPISSQ